MTRLDIDDEDLAGFFNTYRDDISNEGIASIISGEHEFDYWEVTNDEYGDVYESLTPEHKKIVDDKIRSELTNIGKLDINSKTPDLFILKFNKLLQILLPDNFILNKWLPLLKV